MYKTKTLWLNQGPYFNCLCGDVKRATKLRLDLS